LEFAFAELEKGRYRVLFLFEEMHTFLTGMDYQIRDNLV